MSNLENILINKKPGKSVWFMRQAGRYLPEFRAIRSKNPDFLKLCLNSSLASEITLQPINKFDIDSAIIFSDILLVPYALGQQIKFTRNLGPKLSKFDYESFLSVKTETFTKKLNPVYQAIKTTKRKLDKKKSLISFVGAPWTLLIYMLDLKKNKNELNLENPNSKNFNFEHLINKLVEYLCVHIKKQIDAGADVVQIFDSWAGLAPKNRLENYCFLPNAKIVSFCKKEKIPNICFPKGIRKNYEAFNKFVRPDGLNLDYEIDPLWAKEKLKDVVIQGGLDPKTLLRSDNEIYKEATKYIKTFIEKPYVFNLGHGLLPETDPDKVGRLIKFYRNYK